MRWLTCGVAAVLVVVGTSGCELSDADTEQLAVAKCGLPLERELALPAGQRWDRTEVGVEHLGKGAYRVTGVLTIRTDGSADITDRPFTCEVAPDSTDERGFRVTSLTVGAALD